MLFPLYKVSLYWRFFRIDTLYIILPFLIVHFTNSILLEKSSEYFFRPLRLLIKGKWHFSVWRPSGAESVLYAAFENLTLMCPDRIWIPNYIIFSPSEEPKTKHFSASEKVYLFMYFSILNFRSHLHRNPLHLHVSIRLLVNGNIFWNWSHIILIHKRNILKPFATVT